MKFFLHINQQIKDKNSPENLLPKSCQILYISMFVFQVSPVNHSCDRADNRCAEDPTHTYMEANV